MNLKIGDTSENGQITIIDEDRLCYLVKSASRGAEGVRTISKSLLSEYIAYFSKNPNASANDARDTLSGQSDIDKFEYGYTSTLKAMAQMELGQIGTTSVSIDNIPNRDLPFPLQRIFYGAPGTGKSNTIKREVEDQGRAHFRTTFHPDSDYSTFVGCYKPTMVEAPVRDGSGHEVKDAKQEEKNRISYSFVPQAFTKAYCEAWNRLEANEPVFLIVEEINRGNCAQIFGDIFQLLDREMDGARCGFSTYPIDADEDLKAFLETGAKKDGTQWLTNKDGIKDGKLCIPPNLHIWATMNTSDQSLFPIDSAFKRRWDWRYVPIDTEKEQWCIAVNGNKYSWSSFLKNINAEIQDTTSSEDKQLGFYFCKAQNNVISAEMFVSKVLFYIYNDVFKDYGFEREFFKHTDDTYQDQLITFRSFFKSNGDIDEKNVAELLENLGVEKNTNENISVESISPEVDEVLFTDTADEVTQYKTKTGPDYSKFSINGIGNYNKGQLALNVVRTYCELNEYKTTEEIFKDLQSLQIDAPHFIESQQAYESRIKGSSDPNVLNRSKTYTRSNGDKIHVTTQWNLHTSVQLMKALNSRNWGIKIEKK